MIEDKELTIRDATKRFLRFGIDRVMISQHEALPPVKARRQYNIEPVIFFVRKDGWMLGAPENLILAAHRTWIDEWVYFVRRPSNIFQPIKEFKT